MAAIRARPAGQLRRFYTLTSYPLEIAQFTKPDSGHKRNGANDRERHHVFHHFELPDGFEPKPGPVRHRGSFRAMGRRVRTTLDGETSVCQYRCRVRTRPRRLWGHGIGSGRRRALGATEVGLLRAIVEYDVKELFDQFVTSRLTAIIPKLCNPLERPVELGDLVEIH
jgi:hypothetical protein